MTHRHQYGQKLKRVETIKLTNTQGRLSTVVNAIRTIYYRLCACGHEQRLWVERTEP